MLGKADEKEWEIMNNKRRKAIATILNQLDLLKSQLEVINRKFDGLKSDTEDIQYEEEEARDNIPESLQDSERYEISDAACDNLNSAAESLEEVISNLEDAISYLTDAKE